MGNNELAELLKNNNVILYNIFTLLIYNSAKEMQKKYQEVFPKEKNDLPEFIDKVFVDFVKYKKKLIEITLPEHKIF